MNLFKGWCVFRKKTVSIRNAFIRSLEEKNAQQLYNILGLVWGLQPLTSKEPLWTAANQKKVLTDANPRPQSYFL